MTNISNVLNCKISQQWTNHELNWFLNSRRYYCVTNIPYIDFYKSDSFILKFLNYRSTNNKIGLCLLLDIIVDHQILLCDQHAK